MDLNRLPKFRMPEAVMGVADRHRRLNIVLNCQGKGRKAGWMLFGKDGSFYFHPQGKNPVVEVGEAVKTEDVFVKRRAIDVTGRVLEERSGIHVSLHRSGRVHVRGTGGEPLVATDFGAWLPVETAFTFAYIFTQPVADMPEVDVVPRAYEVPEPSQSVRLRIVISPYAELEGEKMVPFLKSTVCIGQSPRYAVLLDATTIPPCQLSVLILASPQGLL